MKVKEGIRVKERKRNYRREGRKEEEGEEKKKLLRGMGGKISNCGIGEERYGIVGEKSEENRRGKGITQKGSRWR